MKIRFTVKDNENQPVEGAKVDIKYGLVDTILLTMDPLKRFNNVEGDLTVKYDSSSGNLSGAGGPVESFSESFVPEDLIKRNNPGHPHTFEVDPTADISFVKIYYKHRFSHETFSVHPDCFINFEYVGIINP